VDGVFLEDKQKLSWSLNAFLKAYRDVSLDPDLDPKLTAKLDPDLKKKKNHFGSTTLSLITTDNSCIAEDVFYIILSIVADPEHFGSDPDPVYLVGI
jgi:hypothetical protein